MILEPPCQTFGDTGHRSVDSPYGVPRSHLAPAAQEELRIDTMQLLVSVKLALAAKHRGLPWALVLARPRAPAPTLIREVVQLSLLAGVARFAHAEPAADVLHDTAGADTGCSVSLAQRSLTHTGS